jgi:predicted nucleic acid-binding protein
MTIHLDTGFLIRALARGTTEDAALRRWLQERAAVDISAVAWTEFLCGPAGERQIRLAHLVTGKRIEFSAGDAALAAELFNSAGRRRGSLADCMIAATAIRRGARLATSNPVDFRRFLSSGLALAL